MPRLVKIALMVQIIYSVCNFGNVVSAQEQMTAKETVNGMLLVPLEGPYQYTSGGVPLYGYINAFASPTTPKDKDLAGKATYQPTDKVKFHVCKTGKEISVNYSDLIHVTQGCGTSGRTWPETTASWPEWKISSGKLVAEQKGKTWLQIGIPVVPNLKDISISDLPVVYQSDLLSEKQGKTVAVTVPTDDGSLLLGILPKRKTGSGS
jgi:hypothetical protein